ncbi:MAG: 4Fe-4S binding protein [Dehalococcoidales bacterium]|nr:4Fe-4S binding protein [Dehalococcoidales bacterium]
MVTTYDTYRRLQQHLDTGPVGYPATGSGIDIRLLEQLFTPEEAQLAVHLSTIKLEPAGRMYRRVKRSGRKLNHVELQAILDRMACQGTILVYREGFNENRYKNAGVTAGGIVDFQVDRLTKELVDTFHEYHTERFAEAEMTGRRGVPQLRTVPVAESIPLPEKHLVATYDDVRHLVAQAPGPLAVANCVCRQTKDIQNKPCGYSDIRETCLQIGPDHARQYVEMGIARYIEKDEACAILDRAQEAGFILQPENSLKPETICCCCGDCCGLLSAVIKSPRPADMYASNYFATVDSSYCNGCGICEERCQMKARAVVYGVATINFDRCIGCGNCVVTCTSGASKLQRKAEILVPPKTKDATFMKILKNKVGTRKMLLLRFKMLLGMKV